MSEPGRPNVTALLQSPDSAPAPHSESRSSTSPAQTPDTQAPLPAGVAPQASAAQPAKTVFGLRQDANHYQPLQNVVFNDDYEHRFPEDPYGQETAPNARIWRVYNEEAAAYDAVYVGQARDGLDVMLVFAGLFSAVVTSFLVQVSQSLQADYTAMSAILLHDLVSVQLSIADGSSSRPNITSPSINPLQTFRPDSITVWVNGLWVVSLAMSLVVALSAVLVKQWFHHYTSIPSGTPAARSHLRQYRFDGLQKWRVNIIIGLFPIIMHTSLVLFLVGLILFFIPLRTSLACAVGVVTVVLCLLYLVSSALPIFFPQCPYQTPLTDFVFYTCLVIRNARDSIPSLTRPLAYDMISVCRDWLLHYLHLHTPHIMFSRVHTKQTEHSKSLRTLAQLEKFKVESSYGKVSIGALDWLLNNSSNPTVHDLAVQAIGGLPPDARFDAFKTWHGRSEIEAMLERRFDALGDSQCHVIECDSVWERRIRSHYFYSDSDGDYWYSCQHTVTEFDEPRFTATALAATFGDRFNHSRDLRKFVCSYHELELHPSIWKGLVQSALRSDSLCFQVKSLQDLSNPDYAHIITLFLPASKPPDESEEVSIQRSTGHSCTVTLHKALTLHVGNISASVQGCILDMLSSFEDDLPVTLPPHYQILYKSAKFALRYLSDEFWASYRDEGTCRYLELLSNVLLPLAWDYNTIFVDHPCFLAPIHKLLSTVIDDTPICEYHNDDTAGVQHLTQLDYSLRVINHLLKKVVSSRRPEFIFPSFHRLGLLPEVPAHYKLSEEQSPYTHPAQQIFILMASALEIGTEAVYQAFINGEWLWMLAERGIVNLNHTRLVARPISAFIRGLQVLDPAAAPGILDYLQQPRNFIITLIMIAFHWDPRQSELLLKLCPKDSSSWKTHRTTLDGIINWCQASNRDDLPFPVDNLFHGKVVQTDDGAVSLDEALQKWLANRWYYKKLECAAHTIILGEAAPWPDE